MISSLLAFGIALWKSDMGRTIILIAAGLIAAILFINARDGRIAQEAIEEDRRLVNEQVQEIEGDVLDADREIILRYSDDDAINELLRNRATGASLFGGIAGVGALGFGQILSSADGATGELPTAGNGGDSGIVQSVERVDPATAEDRMRDEDRIEEPRHWTLRVAVILLVLFGFVYYIKRKGNHDARRSRVVGTAWETNRKRRTSDFRAEGNEQALAGLGDGDASGSEAQRRTLNEPSVGHSAERRSGARRRRNALASRLWKLSSRLSWAIVIFCILVVTTVSGNLITSKLSEYVAYSKPCAFVTVSDVGLSDIGEDHPYPGIWIDFESIEKVRGCTLQKSFNVSSRTGVVYDEADEVVAVYSDGSQIEYVQWDVSSGNRPEGLTAGTLGWIPSPLGGEPVMIDIIAIHSRGNYTGINTLLVRLLYTPDGVTLVDP